MHRRSVIALALAPLVAHAQSLPIPDPSPVDSVVLFVIPTDGVSEQVAAGIARGLTKETGLWIKSTMWVPSGGIEPFAGTNQYPAEDYFPMGMAVAKQLQDANA